MPRKKKTYEDSLLRLEEIVSALEKGNMSLEESLKLFEEGTALSTYCYTALNTAEQKVIELTKEDISQEED